ncbi:MAG: hypothetical protein ACK4NY_12915 [Spirosomataceae bacterium]
MKTKLFLIGLLMLSILSCKKDEVEGDENELITTLKLKFTAGGTTQTFSFKDIDGDGGAAPTIDNIALKPNTTYTLAVEILNESVTPADDITKEVKEEADEHLMVYTPSPANLLTYTYGDKDSRNFPIGLTGTVRTTTAGTGKLKVQLRHQPPASGTPTKNGTATPGSDDINVDFNVTVQ